MSSEAASRDIKDCIIVYVDQDARSRVYGIHSQVSV